MNFSVKTLAATLSVAAFTFAAPQAFAGSVNLTNQGGLGVAPEMVVRTPGDAAQLMYVGGYKEHVNTVTGTTLFSAGQSLIVWCLDVALHKAGTANYTVEEVTGQPSPSWISGLEQLYTRFSSMVTDAVSSAAMQLAVWEVVGGDSTLSLASGDFQASPTGPGKSQDAFDLAQSWLNTLNTSPAVWNAFRVVTLSYADGEPLKQDLVTFIPTPLPGAALMFLSALGLGGLARRKLSGGAEPTAA